MIATFRPSRRELLNKLRDARAVIVAECRCFARPDKAVGELLALDVTADEVWCLLAELLGELSPENYVGLRPPQRSYERSIVGRELFAFAWKSARLKNQMYLKFALVDGCYYYVSPHKAKKAAGGR